MTIYTRLRDGASIDAELFDGSAESFLRVTNLIGTAGINFRAFTLTICREEITATFTPGVWIVKSKCGWVAEYPARFANDYAIKQGKVDGN